MRRVLVMSSSGLASSTMKSALLPASSVPASARRRNSAELRGGATITCAGGIPATTMASIRSRGPDPWRRRHSGHHPVLHLLVRPPRPVAVGAERDAHAGGIEPGQVAGLDAVKMLRGGLVGIGRFELREFGGRQARPQPAQVDL